MFTDPNTDLDVTTAGTGAATVAVGAASASTATPPAPVAPVHKKFMFDLSFEGTAAANKPPERKPVLMKPEQIDSMKRDAYDEGFAAGSSAGKQAQTQQLMTVMSLLDERLGAAIAGMQQQQIRDHDAINKIALAIARKILPTFIAQNGLQEIQAMLTSAIAEMVHEPRLVVRTHDSEFDMLNAKIQEISAQKAYAGKVVVLADAEIAQGDCRVEWADGGIERNVESTWNAIEQIITPDTPR